MRPYIILAIVLLISVCPSLCKEVAYAFGPDGEKPVGQANITDYKGTDVVSFTVSAAPRGPTTGYKTQWTVDEIKDEINEKVDRGNQLVRDEGLRLVGSKSGAQRIDQFCAIYDYMVGNWTYVGDWRGLELFQYSNYTLRMGNDVGKSGKGDCDDFSILLASLIESIGGTPRIIFAYSPAGGHAYTEVYLGKNNSKDLDRMLEWLRTEYRTNNVYIHKDDNNEDVWLNMDWWKDPGGANHPGGPLYQAATHIPIYIQEDMPKTFLTPIENLPPIALFSYSPTQPGVGEVVNFDASQSKDLEGKIVDYEWDFGDGGSDHGTFKSICSHIYSSSGTFQVNLTVTDNEGNASSKALEIDVIKPLSQAIETHTSREEDHLYKEGRFNLDRSNYSWALYLFDEAIRINPNFEDAWRGKAEALNGIHQYNESIKASNRALEIDPSDSDAWALRAFALGKLGIQEGSLSKLQDSWQAYSQALKIDPSNEAARNGRNDINAEIDKNIKGSFREFT
jgi:PKD repeat protein